jgi:hypothetical protein
MCRLAYRSSGGDNRGITEAADIPPHADDLILYTAYVSQSAIAEVGVPGRIRTCDPLLRRQPL